MPSEPSNILLLSGDEAVAQGAYEAGLEVACSYPGTPATEILEYLARYPDVQAQWSVNEKVAFEVALGAAWGGVRSLFSAKHVGLNVALDPLMTSAYTGVNAGMLVVSGDDPGLHSSQNEQDNRLLARFAKIPLLEPSSPAESYDFAQLGFGLSEHYDLPVLVRLTTRIAHTKENVRTGKRMRNEKKPFSREAAKYVMVPGNAYKRHLVLEEKLVRMKEAAETSALNRIEPGDQKLGIVTGGVSYLYGREKFPDASFLKLGFTNPLPEDMIRRFASSVDELFVLEENEPFLEDAVRAMGLKVRAKKPSFRVGELRPELIPAVLAGEERVTHPAPGKRPAFCPGCPHSPVFLALRNLGVAVAGDIGCYALAAAPPYQSLHTCLDMGSGVTLTEGFLRAGEKDVVGVLGDSTFVHSGITGLVNMAYNGVKGVIVILDNGTTAMTGAQDNPATGVTAQGAKTFRLDLEAIARAAGAEEVDVVSDFTVADLEGLVRRRLEGGKLSVVIARNPCKMIEGRP